MKKTRREFELDRFEEKILPELDAVAIHRDPIKAQDRFNALSLEDQVAAALQRSGKDRLELILLSKRARSIVQRLPEQEWYMTIKEVGDEDSLPLLALSSPGQITYLFDIEWWHRDMLDPLLVIHWLALLMECGLDKVKQWIKKVDAELLTLILAKFIHVYKTDPEDEGREPWRGLSLFTLDESYYIQFLDENLRPPLENFLKMLREIRQDGYYALLDDLESMVPSEFEESAAHFRNSRMEEYGFPEFDEALEIYSYVIPGRIKELAAESSKTKVSGVHGLPPRYPLAMKDMPALLSRALSLIDSGETIEELQFEFARLANHVMIADSLRLDKLENIEKAMRKTAGYVEIGLEVIAESDPGRAAGLLAEKPLKLIFQAGYSQALRMHFRAERLIKYGWPRQVDDPLELCGPVDGPLLKGISQSRPIYSPGPGERDEGTFRDFESMAEILRCDRALTLAEVQGPLFFEALGFHGSDLDELRAANIAEVTWFNVFSTAIVKGLASGRFSFHPLLQDDVKAFVLESMTSTVPRKIKIELIEEFLSWLGRRLSDLGPATVAASTAFANDCINMLEAELARLDINNIDPRFLEVLILK